MCEENLRGIRFNILDVTLHADTIHRGGGQIIPTCRRVCYASFLKASPTLQEPVFLAEIQCPEVALGGIFSVLNKRRGIVNSQDQPPGTPLYNVKAYLPVNESFGFTTALRAATGGQAFPQCSFDHYDNVVGSIDDPKSKLMEIIDGVRAQKKLTPGIPAFEKFYDKL